MGVNDPPTGVTDAFSLDEDTTLDLPVLANDSSAPDSNETLRVSSVSSASGTLTINGGTSITYRAAPNFSGQDTFTYGLDDGNGGTDSATVTLTITNIDFQPVAVADTLTVVEDGSGTVAVLANDTALTDGPLTVTLAAAPTRGTALVQADNTVRYVPNTDAVGTDTFRYTVTDADGDAATATVTVTITPANDLPTPVADVATTQEDTSVKTNDTGLGDGPITLAVTVAPAHGTTTLEADGTVSYLPAANYVGADTFTYSLTDADAQQGTAVVSLTVTAVNDAPVAVADTSATKMGIAVDIDVMANDTDVDGDTLSVTSVTAPAHGTVTVVAGKARYVPAPSYRGPDRFDYVVSDGALTATGAVVLTVGLDSDGDGLQDDAEVTLGTDPLVADTDRDLIADGLEVNVTRTLPLDDDTDDDGLLDGNEDLSRNGMLDPSETDPRLADTDGDELLDGTERGLAAPQGRHTAATVFVADLSPCTRTDPLLVDTDSGGVPDGTEDANHNGRVDSGETNPLAASDDIPRAPDADGDGVPDATDNCPQAANATQADANKDGVGDACEAGGCGCAAADTGALLPLVLALWGAFAARRRRS